MISEEYKENSYNPEDFIKIGCDNENSEKFERKPMTYWKLSWLKFRSNKVAMIALIVLIIITIMTIIGPKISKYSIEEINLKMKNQRPNSEHWFGTDKMGRDIFSRVWQGGRVSILIGIIGSVVVVIIGCIYGGLSAYFGGKVDTIMMRIVEILSSVPHLLVVIMFSVIIDSSSIGTLLIAMTITGWCSTARLVRSQMLQISSTDYVTAAKIMGVSPMKSVVKHLIPNTLSVIIVHITFRIPGFIFGEAFLSYIGLGVQPPATSWGALCSAAYSTLFFYPYQLLFPAALISITMLCFTLIGDGLRDALDPKLRK